MRFVGIDIGGERHAMAVVKGEGAVLTRPTVFTEDAAGIGSCESSSGIQRTAWSPWRRLGIIAQFARVSGERRLQDCYVESPPDPALRREGTGTD
jgi:hypothetical protein